jgi:hypothetical protein
MPRIRLCERLTMGMGSSRSIVQTEAGLCQEIGFFYSRRKAASCGAREAQTFARVTGPSL